MTWLAIGLSSCGMVLLIWAIRGRVIARGRFCRRCRFDLAGLDAAGPAAACPECGSHTSEPRPRLRARRRGMLAGALLLFLGAGVCWSTRAPAVQTWLLPRVPDRALLGMLRVGGAGTESEIVDRLMDPRRDAAAYQALIDDALAVVLQLRESVCFTRPSQALKP